jgi:hypothetical protein
VIYPNSTPEFRVLQKLDGAFVLQVRYINIAQGYTSKWEDVPLVKEEQNG